MTVNYLSGDSAGNRNLYVDEIAYSGKSLTSGFVALDISEAAASVKNT